MFFNSYLKEFVKVGSLSLIDSNGKKTTFKGTPAPSFTIHLHSTSLPKKLLSSPHVALGEALHQHYAETLRCWRERFNTNKDKVIQEWGERFFRMWEFYLVSCEIAFRKKGYMVFQIQMVKDVECAPVTSDYISANEKMYSCSEPLNLKKRMRA